MYDYNNPLYNPMVNPYLGIQRPYQQQARQEVVKVNGENGARAFQIPPNSSALLLDESGVIVWLVTTDGAGYKSVAPFDITPHETDPAPDYSSLEQRITRLEEMISNANTGNPANAQRTEYTAFTDTAARPASAACRDDQERWKSAGTIAADDATAKPSAGAGDGLHKAEWRRSESSL